MLGSISNWTGGWPVLPAEPRLRRPSQPRCAAKRGRRWALALGVVMSCGFSTMAAAQDDKRPYDADLMRLTEILGAVHYLRAICGSDDGTRWRDQMQAIINAEGSTTLRRVNLTQRFNKGYRSYQRTYRTCTPSAETAVMRFIEEGAALAQKLGTKDN